ncbi:MAG: 4-alpha-glucanotransferase [Desulfuromonadales bacterium]|nr:4-alpha-glucanotransferase [Desulfuromonadales bacterium]
MIVQNDDQAATVFGAVKPLARRRSGVLLHPTALPGPGGIGSFGREALNFIDFLAAAGQSVWQMLPLGPTGYGDSPYNALSAFAGNPLLIDSEQLVTAGALADATATVSSTASGKVDYARVRQEKEPLLQNAASRFFSIPTDAPPQHDFARFCREQNDWLDDYTLFMAIRQQQEQKPWWQWPRPLRRRDKSALDRFRAEYPVEIRTRQYEQFIFNEQWSALRGYAHQHGVLLFGDLPIFVARDSADVWAHQRLFQLDAAGEPTAVAGVPPDYFSATGQLWGNPLYRWEEHVASDFAWWRQRFRHQLQLFDLVRVDHFRGFQACWSVPAGDATAERGHWEEVPGEQLFRWLHEDGPDLPIVAEDLGVITPEVEQLRDTFGFPGMKILQFAFDSDSRNPYLPHNHRRNAVVYTGTHDNDTTCGWWQSCDDTLRDRVRRYLHREQPDLPWDLIRLAMASVARLCVIPCQDLLALDAAARFNRPGMATGNWSWRLTGAELDPPLAEHLRELTCRYNRLDDPSGRKDSPC